LRPTGSENYEAQINAIVMRSKRTLLSFFFYRTDLLDSAQVNFVVACNGHTKQGYKTINEAQNIQ
jgi:hypothetical protein